MGLYDDMAFDGMHDRLEIRRQQIEAGVARQDYPEWPWIRRIDSECSSQCENCFHYMLHVFSRGGQLWHFCARCDT